MTHLTASSKFLIQSDFLNKIKVQSILKYSSSKLEEYFMVLENGGD